MELTGKLYLAFAFVLAQVQSADRPLQMEIVPDEHRTARIAFPTEPGASYELQRSADLTEWLPASSVFVARGDLMEFQITASSGNSIYRVVKVENSASKTSPANLPLTNIAVEELIESTRSFSTASANTLAPVNATAPANVVDLYSFNRYAPFQTRLPWVHLGEDDGGPAAWVEKVKWLLMNGTLIAHPLDK